MGLDVFTTLWDWLKQGFLFLVGALFLFLVVYGASNDAFFMKYYAKDVGLVLEAAHAARGDVELDYAKLMPGDAYDYNATPTGLLLRDHKHTLWKLRKRYGATLDGPRVTASVLLDPQALVVRRRADNITLGGEDVAPARCPALADRPTRADTLVRILGDSPLITENVLRVEDVFTPKRDAKLTIDVTVRRDPQAPVLVITGAATDVALGDALVCSLAEALAPVDVETEAARALGQPPRVELTVTHPDLPGLDDDKLAGSIIQALDGVLS